jgi:hypothetical protein
MTTVSSRTHHVWCTAHEWATDGEDADGWDYCSRGERFSVGTELITDINEAA